MKTTLTAIAAILVGVLSVVSPSLADTSVDKVLQQEQRGLFGLRGAPLENLFKPKKKTKISYSAEFLDGLPKAKGDEEWACLAEALYFEARGESVKGQFAVAEVILNRVASSRFPDTVCGVVNQGTGRKYQCQFTYTCDGKEEIVANRQAYNRVGKVAQLMINGGPRSLTDGATYYHTKAVRPKWSRKFDRTTTIGVHHFYRHPTEVSLN